jgi:hypothetical protein
MPIDVKYSVVGKFPTFPPLFNKWLKATKEDIAQTVTNIAREETPEGATKNLRESIDAIQTNRGVEVRWTAPYAQAVDQGSSPHWAPIAPLASWTNVKAFNAFSPYQLQASIAKKGTKANGFVARTLARFQNRLDRFLTLSQTELRALLNRRQ